MFQRLAAALLLRKVSTDLHAIAEALREQNVLLTRLAAHWAPVDPKTSRPEVEADTGVSHLDAIDAILAQEFVARVQQDTGHTPDDDEILIYLADEKTHELHARLAMREVELSRLRAERTW